MNKLIACSYLGDLYLHTERRGDGQTLLTPEKRCYDLIKRFLEIKVCHWISDPSKQIHASQCAHVQVLQKKNLFYNVIAFDLKSPLSLLSSAIYINKWYLYRQYPNDNVGLFIGDNYDIGACDYIKIIFLLPIKVINHILGGLEFNLQLICFYIVCWH